jgi:hypothetical protein
MVTSYGLYGGLRRSNETTTSQNAFALTGATNSMRSACRDSFKSGANHAGCVTSVSDTSVHPEDAALQVSVGRRYSWYVEAEKEENEHRQRLDTDSV